MAGLTLWDIGGCGCSGAGTLTTFTGCYGGAIASYQIDIYNTMGGTLLESVTTNSLGQATVVSTGSVWIQTHDGRFSGQTVTLPSGTVALTAVGSGYACSYLCAVPLKTTLYYTDSNGTIPLVFAAGTWTGCAISAAQTTAFNCVGATTTLQVAYGIQIVTTYLWQRFDLLNTSGTGPLILINTARLGLKGYCVGNNYTLDITGCPAYMVTGDISNNMYGSPCNPFSASGSWSATTPVPVSGAWTLTE